MTYNKFVLDNMFIMCAKCTLFPFKVLGIGNADSEKLIVLEKPSTTYAFLNSELENEFYIFKDNLEQLPDREVSKVLQDLSTRIFKASPDYKALQDVLGKDFLDNHYVTFVNRTYMVDSNIQIFAVNQVYNRIIENFFKKAIIVGRASYMFFDNESPDFLNTLTTGRVEEVNKMKCVFFNDISDLDIQYINEWNK